MYDLLVVVHVVSAAVWVGGVVVLTFVAVPVAQRQTSPLRGELLRDFGRRWRPIGWGALALAIATGIPVADHWNAFDRDVLFDTRFGRLLLMKTGLVALLISLSVAHSRLGGALARQIREGRDQSVRTPSSRPDRTRQPRDHARDPGGGRAPDEVGELLEGAKLLRPHASRSASCSAAPRTRTRGPGGRSGG